MATVELLLSPLAVHVRTARLVGVSVARRAGLSDGLLDELRLALGEACSRAVGLHAVHAPDVPVRILLRDDATGFSVEVTDVGPAAEPVESEVGDLLHDEEAGPEVALAVLQGLVDDLQITPGPGGTLVTMRWPLAL